MFPTKVDMENEDVRRLSLFCLVITLQVSSVLAVGGRRKYRHDLSFSVPSAFFKDPTYVSASYLESFPVVDTNKHLSEKNVGALCRLFVAAYDSSTAKFNQDYPIATSAPIYKLLKTNVPRVSQYETEGGRLVFLGRIKECLTASIAPPPQH